MVCTGEQNSEQVRKKIKLKDLKINEQGQLEVTISSECDCGEELVEKFIDDGKAVQSDYPDIIRYSQIKHYSRIDITFNYRERGAATHSCKYGTHAIVSPQSTGIFKDIEFFSEAHKIITFNT